LKKLALTANDHIKSLCHTKTKCFEIDYLVTESNGNIHINWLVKTDDDNKQTISVKQASGFQQFAISLALRMSLFGNRQCQQLFIDEGFTACDKQNLSIVPSFLKGLLKTFHTVIIVSHIDIIQDSIDNVAYIYYDKSTNNSKMTYGDMK
jgi:DNA repair exonuclease SbcCD ATPase subunit